ncbi:Metallo-hydrolase/oxidoreductase superfamily protein [Perilla frutescens var. frutescens]|nr:Metallo-hydrolase/oxidoreductase superfamily protein [Perilla frutescens var. frutescens]
MGTQQRVNLAVIIKNPLKDDELLLTKQALPPKFNDPEYDSYQDSDLWDLPSAQLSLLDRSLTTSQVQFEIEDSSVSELLNQFDVGSAADQVLREVGLEKTTNVKWNFLKVIEEPEFGPGVPVKTLYIVGESEIHDWKLGDCSKWMSTKSCEDLLLEVKPHNDRIGPLVVVGLLNDSLLSANLHIPPTLRSLDYPPGVKLVPMKSRTAKPFRTTNLIVFVPGTSYNGFNGDSFLASGDALIVDPGCSSAVHKELEQIVTALPRKLIVFVTHHHHDHVDGLSVVQKCNPDATLLTHENTYRRIGKDDWSLGHIPVLGSEEICVGGQRLRFISAPGHTDGHVALLHVATNSLIVGDHCVGQGSALLDITAGGDMSDYFNTTYKFMELSPHVLIPMHGRVNMWPKHMLCGYLKNRRKRESTILKAIEDGAKTLFDIVKYTYADVDRSLWFHASSNVRLHVDHLALQNKLPQEFSMQRFQSSCKLSFFSRWIWEYLTVSIKHHHLQIVKVLGAGAAASFAVLYLRSRDA